MKYSWIVLLLLGLALSCGQGQPGVQGPKGDPGAPGTPAMIPVSATPPTACNNTNTGMFYVDTSAGMPRLSFCDGTKWAPFAGDPDCPMGYARDQTATGIVLCKKGADEVVKVGSGGSAFWIDRYEASVWQNSDGTGTQYGASGDDYPPLTFPKNGQWALVSQAPLYAMSKAGVSPSASLTWFQAVEACAASGKALPGRQEWLRAGQGTEDRGAMSGGDGSCVTQTSGPRNTGGGTKCVSVWGAQDMIGNVAEWTDEWYASVGKWDFAMDVGAFAAQGRPWPAGYNDDLTNNITSHVDVDQKSGTSSDSLPAAAMMGGSWSSGTAAGVFNLDLNHAPSDRLGFFGFRCVVRR